MDSGLKIETQLRLEIGTGKAAYPDAPKSRSQVDLHWIDGPFSKICFQITIIYQQPGVLLPPTSLTIVSQAC